MIRALSEDSDLQICEFDQSLLDTLSIAKDLKLLHGDGEDSDQISWMCRLIRVLAVDTCHFVDFIVSIFVAPALAWAT